MSETVQHLARWLEASGWGTVVGFVASLLGIVGLGFAYREAHRAKTAAEAAKTAAEAAVGTFQGVEAVRRLAQVVKGLDDLAERLDGGNLRQLRRDGRDLRGRLGEIVAPDRLLPSEDRLTIKEAMATLRQLESLPDAEAARVDDATALRSALSERYDELNAVLHDLQDRIARRDDGSGKS